MDKDYFNSKSGVPFLLSPQQKLLLERMATAFLPPAKAAATLGMNHSTAATQMARARRKFEASTWVEALLMFMNQMNRQLPEPVPPQWLLKQTADLRNARERVQVLEDLLRRLRPHLGPIQQEWINNLLVHGNSSDYEKLNDDLNNLSGPGIRKA